MYEALQGADSREARHLLMAEAEANKLGSGHAHLPTFAYGVGHLPYKIWFAHVASHFADGCCHKM